MRNGRILFFLGGEGLRLIYATLGPCQIAAAAKLP
jgi:hypothetical protein